MITTISTNIIVYMFFYFNKKEKSCLIINDNKKNVHLSRIYNVACKISMKTNLFLLQAKELSTYVCAAILSSHPHLDPPIGLSSFAPSSANSTCSYTSRYSPPSFAPSGLPSSSLTNSAPGLSFFACSVRLYRYYSTVIFRTSCW